MRVRAQQRGDDHGAATKRGSQHARRGVRGRQRQGMPRTTRGSTTPRNGARQARHGNVRARSQARAAGTRAASVARARAA